MKITSSANPKIKRVVKLKNRSTRREMGITVVEGVREIMRACEAGVEFKELYVCRELLKEQGQARLCESISDKVPVYEMDKPVFGKISFGDRKEGILALCEAKLPEFSSIKVSPQPLFVVIENVEKPGNLGAILRTCDGAGVDALIVSDEATDIYNPNVIRSSLGTVFSVPIVQGDNAEVLNFLKQKKVKIVATSPEAGQVYFDAALEGALAIVVGSEQEGLSDFWLEQADVKVKIPMHGKADSLNASVSAAILVYEAVRQRG